MTDLKPCPFCGASPTADIWTRVDGETDGLVFCSGTIEKPHYGLAVNLAAWNTRAAPKVKPLEWVAGDGETASEEYYTAEPIVGMRYWVNEGQWGMLNEPDVNPLDEFFDSDDEAKAAAQADYTHRILSALTPEIET